MVFIDFNSQLPPLVRAQLWCVYLVGGALQYQTSPILENDPMKPLERVTAGCKLTNTPSQSHINERLKGNEGLR